MNNERHNRHEKHISSFENPPAPDKVSASLWPTKELMLDKFQFSALGAGSLSVET